MIEGGVGELVETHGRKGVIKGRPGHRLNWMDLTD